jgi:hypothetical protein
MASEVSICNVALGWLGQTPISSLTDASVTAQLCRDNYDEARMAVLEEGVWSFAQRKFVLSTAIVPTSDMWSDGHYFLIPGDILKVREAYQFPRQPGDPLEGWTVEGKYLVSWWDTVYCLGTEDIKTPDAMDSAFRAALAARLAADLCLPITQSNTMAGDMWTLYEDKLTRAAVIDASQSRRYAVGGGRISRARWGDTTHGRI